MPLSFYLFGRLRAHFEVFQVVLARELLCLLHRHLPALLVCQVQLVPDQKHHDLRVTEIAHFLQPEPCNVIKRFSACQIENYRNALSPFVFILFPSLFTFIVTACYRPESLLTCRVPDLKLDTRPIDTQSLESEVHPDRAEVHVTEGVVTEPEQQRGFAHCAISCDHHLE